MIRTTDRVLLGLALALMCGASAGRAGEPAKPAAPAPNSPRTGADSIRQKLAAPIDAAFDANTPLRDALENLAEHFGLPIVVNQEAFKAAGVDVESVNVGLARVNRIPLRDVLRLILNHVQATYLVREGYVEITTQDQAAREIWGDVRPPEAVPEDTISQATSGRKRPMMALVQASFDNRPLPEALRELSEETGINIALDLRRAGDKGKAAVTADLKNVPVDTAVRLLADQADLSVVLLDNVLYVTTPENARRVRAEQERLNRRGLDAAAWSSWPNGPGGGM